MTTRIAGLACLLAVLSLGVFPQTASGSTHLLVPRFTSVPEDDSYLEISNGNDHEVWFELRAFSSSGQVLDVSRVWAPPHSSTTLPLRETFAFREQVVVTGWIDAFAIDDNVLLTLHSGVVDEQLDAATPEEFLVLPVGYLNRPMIWLANSNRFPVNFTATAYDASGHSLGERQLALGESTQLAVPVTDIWQSEIATLTIAANGGLAAVAEEDSQEPVQAEQVGQEFFSILAANDVAPATPILRSIVPRSDFLARTVSMTFTGQGLSAVTGVLFIKDAGIDAGILATITSKTDTVLSASVEIKSIALVGRHKVALVTSTGSTLTTAVNFEVLGPLPALNTPSGLSPDRAKRGSTLIFKLLGSNFGPVNGVQFLGADNNPDTGLRASIRSRTASLVTTQLTISNAAAIGGHSVVLVLANGSTTSTGQTFSVEDSTPTITSIDPRAGTPGTDVPVTVIGDNFISGRTTLLSTTGGGGLSFTRIRVLGPTSLLATIRIQSATQPGVRTIVVRTNNGQSDTVGSSVSFEVKPSSEAPKLTSIDPISFTPGATAVAVTLAGSNFGSAAKIFVNGVENGISSDLLVTGTGQTTSSITRLVTVAANTAGGTRTVKVRANDIDSNELLIRLKPLLNSLTLSGIGTATPSTPVSVSAGTVPITLSGTGFVPDLTDVRITGSGVRVRLTSSSLTELQGTLIVDSRAAFGNRDISVRTAGGDSATIAITVDAPGPPTLKSVHFTVLPSSGNTGIVAVNLTGTNFTLNGTTQVSTSSSGITVTNVVVQNSNAITAKLQVDTSVPNVYAQDLKVVTPSGPITKSLLDELENNFPKPVLKTVSPSAAKQDTAAFSVTVTGSGFLPGATTIAGNSGAPNPVKVLNATTGTANLVVSGPLCDCNLSITTPSGESTDSVVFKIVGALSISSTIVDDGVVGKTYSFTVAASGGALPRTWSLIGELPAGLTLNPNGTISGTPSTAGTKSFTVKVTDSLNPAQTATQPLSIRIAAPLSITTPSLSTLPNGLKDQAYSFTLAATGGLGAHTWSVATGSSLPDGLELTSATGAISWTPTNAGTSTFTLTVTDSATPAQTVDKALTITIDRATPVITWSNPADITYGTALSNTQLNADTPVAGSFTYTPAAEEIVNAGSQSLSVTFTPTDTPNYNSATKTVTINVAKATPTVNVIGGTFAYTGNARSATGSVIGVNSQNLGSPTFSYSTETGQAPVNVGVYAVSASFGGNSNYNAASSAAPVVITINKANPTVAVTGGTFTYDGNSHPATGSVTGVQGESLGTLTFTYNGGSTVPVNAASYSVTGSFAGNDNYNAASNSDASIVISKATPAITWSNPAGITYGTLLSGTQLNATVNPNVGTLAYTPDTGDLLEAGSRTLQVLFTPDSNNSTNYNTAQASVTISVAKATPTVTLTGGTFTYDGNAHPATGSVTGVNSQNLGTPTFTYNDSSSTPVNADSYTVIGSFAGNSNYNSATGTATITINKANPTVSVQDSTFTYDGNAHAATGSVTGVGSENLGTPTFTYNGSSSTPVNADSYTVIGSFAGNSNYNSATSSTSATLTINKATPTVSITGGTFTYDGNEHPATASVVGVNSQNLGTPTCTYNGGPAVPVNAGPYTVACSFAGNNNYSAVSNTVTDAITIAKATPVITWGNPAGITYGTLLSGTQLNATVNPNVGTLAYTPDTGDLLEAGSRTLQVLFTPDSNNSTNYNTAQASVTISVAKATPTVTLTGGTFTYDGNAHAATGSVTGVNSQNLGTPTFTYTPGGSTAPVDVGTYTVTASFAGNGNYNSANSSGSATITINKATPTVTATGGTFTYDGASHPATGSVTGASGESLGALTFSYILVSTGASSGTPVNAGVYAASGLFAGNSNYNAASSSPVIITINKATPTVSITGGTFTYDGNEHPAIASVIGVNSQNLGMPTCTYNGGSAAPVNAGSYTVACSFAGNDNYIAASNTVTDAITIAKATPVITWSNPAGITSGTALSGTQLNATVNPNVGTLTYTPDAGTVLDAGTQTLQVLFTPDSNNSTNYNTAQASVTIIIE